MPHSIYLRATVSLSQLGGDPPNRSKSWTAIGQNFAGS